MNFQHIPPIESGKTLLDLAFRKARERAAVKKRKGDPFEISKKKETIKLDVIKAVLEQRLQKLLQTFPKERELPQFYQKLLKITLDVEQFRKSLGSIKWSIAQLQKLHRSYVQKINKARNIEDVKKASKEFYGRISSILKQINQYLQFLNETRRVLRTYPDIKEMFTVCIYGFPNVGKSTLLNKITGTKAKTASYAFTTLTINAGYLNINEQKVQVLDVPGTLARPDKMNNIEKQAELVLQELASLVIYVFDPTEHSGYSLQKQEQLFNKIEKEKKVLVYYSRKDLLTETELKQLKHPHHQEEELKKKILEEATNCLKSLTEREDTY